MRPKTLAAVAQLTLQGDSFDVCLANFLDGFYSAPTDGALAPPPVLLAPVTGEPGAVQDSYLAATAEHLAGLNGFQVPIWARAEAHRLHWPWFASPLASLRTVLLLESPAAFRARNLFVSANALTRV